MQKAYFYVAMALVLFVMASCGSDSSSPTEPNPPTAAELCATGWTQFESDNFTGAATSFQNAINTDSNYCEAYIGLAITRIRQDNFTDAKTQLTTAKTKSPTTNQSIAISLGLSFVYVKENNATGIITELSGKITGTDTFDIGYGTGIDAVDIHNLLCEAYIMNRTLGTEGGSAMNALDAWGQVKKALALDGTDAKALQMQAYLRGTR